MKKIIILIASIALSLSANAQSWMQMGNTLQRQINGVDTNYRFNMGSPGFSYFYSKPQVDNIIINKATYTAGYGLGLSAFQFRLDSTVAVNKTFFNSVIGTATLNRINARIPYIGATTDVDLGSHNITTTGSGLFNNYVQSRNFNIYSSSTGGTASITYGPGGITGFKAQYLQDKNGTFAYLDDITSALTGYVPVTRAINTTNGILGGGNLSSDLTLQVDSTKYQTIANFFPKGDIRYYTKIQADGKYLQSFNGRTAINAVPTAGDYASLTEILSNKTISYTNNSIDATHAQGVNVINDNTLSSIVYPTWVQAGSSYNSMQTSTSKLSYVPNTGNLISTSFEAANKFILQQTSPSNLAGIYLNSDRYLHNYKPTGGKGNNIFLGRNSGNMTMTALVPDSACCNTAVGDSTAMELTHGYVNSYLGFKAGMHARAANGEVGIGTFALMNDMYGIHNVGVGYGALENIAGDRAFTYGLENIGLGFFAGSAAIRARQSIFIGSNAGSSGGQKTDCIDCMVLGSNANVGTDYTFVYGDGLVQNQIFAGDLTFYGQRSTGITGTGKFVYSISPTITGVLTGQDANFSGKVSFGSGIFATNTTALYNDATNGTTFTTHAGSVNDFNLTNNAGSNVLTIPTGTTNVSVVGSLTAQNIYSTSATPSISVTGAGSSPSISIAGSNQDQIIQITTGAGSGSMAITVTMSGSYAYPHSCIPTVTAYSSAAQTAGWYVSGLGTTNYTINTGATTASTVYYYTVHNGGY